MRHDYIQHKHVGLLVFKQRKAFLSVVCDLDGLAVLERLRESQLKKQPNVIMLTAFGQEDVTKKAVDLGASYFILRFFFGDSGCGRSTLL